MEVIEITSLEALSRFARRLVEAHPEGAVYGLKGDLGAGKTTLVRAVAAILCGDKEPPRVTSPSFVLHQHYDLSVPLDHWDLYRLNALDEEALTELGYPEVVEQARSHGGWVFVEWPDRAVPRDALELTGELTLVRESDTVRTIFWNPSL